MLTLRVRSCSFVSAWILDDGVCIDILCGVGLVVHEEKVDFAWVVDEEDLVARWGHVLGLLVAAETNLYNRMLVSIIIAVASSRRLR